MIKIVSEFRELIYSSEKKFLTISEEQSCIQPQPGKWNSKQILGHLVDSSINNITRFINGQFQEDFVFQGYNQDDWVARQRYDDAEWAFIINVWKNNNLQIARVVESIPADVFRRFHKKHNFNKISFKELAEDKPASLEYLFIDYVDHMKHHLRKIFEINSLDEN